MIDNWAEQCCHLSTPARCTKPGCTTPRPICRVNEISGNWPDMNRHICRNPSMVQFRQSIKRGPSFTFAAWRHVVIEPVRTAEFLGQQPLISICLDCLQPDQPNKTTPSSNAKNPSKKPPESQSPLQSQLNAIPTHLWCHRVSYYFYQICLWMEWSQKCPLDKQSKAPPIVQGKPSEPPFSSLSHSTTPSASKGSVANLALLVYTTITILGCLSVSPAITLNFGRKQVVIFFFVED